jgi:hypothetical protein
MDQKALVERDIDAGRRLVQALDQSGFAAVAALWNYLPEEAAWRLVIASPKVSELGPREAYAIIQDALRKGHIDLSLARISAVSPDEEPLVTELRIFAGTDPAPFLGGTYFLKAVIGHLYVEGAYVYRAERIFAKSGTFDLWCVARDKPRKVWIARPCKVTFEEGFLKTVEGEGVTVPQSHSRGGINAHLDVLANPEERHGRTVGDVQRLTIRGGRLRAIDTIARGVPIEGYAVGISSARATT